MVFVYIYILYTLYRAKIDSYYYFSIAHVKPPLNSNKALFPFEFTIKDRIFAKCIYIVYNFT